MTQTQARDGHGTVRRRDCWKKYGGIFQPECFLGIFSTPRAPIDLGFFAFDLYMTTVRAVSAAGGMWCCSVRQTITRPEFDCHYGDFGNDAAPTVKEQ